MKINGTAPIRSATARRAATAAKGAAGAFASELSAPAEEAGASAGAAPSEAVQALLLIQEVPDAAGPAKRAARRGEDMLDRLEELQRDLLLGALPRERMVQLAQLVRTRREQAADPRLAAVLDEIELRCRVELAKLAAAAA